MSRSLLKLENNPMADEPPARPGPDQDDDAPLRAAPLSAAQLAVHGRQLAARHQTAGTAPAADLPVLLSQNADAIARACDTLDRAARAGIEIPAAGARLLDQYHLVDAQVRLARGQLLQGVRPLPHLGAGGKVEGEPRAWRLVLEAVAHGDGRVEPDQLARFLAAYQEGAPLALAELDALPCLLRLALIDNLRRLAARAARACLERDKAAGWAVRMVDTSEQRPGDLILLVADMAREVQPLGSSFVAELARRLQGQGGVLAQALDWIDTRLADEGSGIAQQLQLERSEQADDAVSAANSLASLRLAGGVDWRAFAEQIGAVEQVLRADPDGSYARMDGATRDQYRQAVERLARATGHGETEVAQEALALSGIHLAPGEGGLDRRTRHVGYYLAGPGREQLEERLRADAGPARRLRRLAQRRPLAARIGALVLLALLFTATLVSHARQDGVGAGLLAVIGLLALAGASELARAMVRMMAGWIAPPPPTPRMDFGAGIPHGAQALVAVSASLGDEGQVAALCRDLEVRYLGNRDPRLRFCLLADLPDAGSAQMPGDQALLERARAAIDALNARYGHEQVVETYDEQGEPDAATARIEPFLLLVRTRTWSPSEHAWIGRERRRGQLADLNDYLCGAKGNASEQFVLAAGALQALAELRYVIAIDSATSLPIDAARRLVAAMAHPLNQPVLGKDGRVLEGHGLLRPAVRAALPEQGATRYERLWADGAGTWAGPGAGCGASTDPGLGWAAIYDIDAWQRACGGEGRGEGRPAPGLPEEDRLRCGAVHDLRLDALHPATYGEHALRRHRAARAHWQIAGSLGSRKDPAPLVQPHARWRLFDRLRESLAAPALLVLLVLCWSLLAAPVFWSMAVLSVYFLPALFGSLVALADRPHDAPWRQHLDGWARGARVPLVRAALSAAFLPHAAFCQFDAALKGLWRRNVSRRRLLESRPAFLARPGAAIDSNWRSMWFAPALAVGVAVLLTFVNPYALFSAAPLLLVWFLSPTLAWWISQPARSRTPRLAAAENAFLRALARRNWSFFEDHPGAKRLAPEAVLEHPQPAVDARVSPAGMGLSLLAGLAAHDFGFLPASALLDRTQAILASMELLESWRGHVFEWYDGATLAPVEPAFVSTAASGSLLLSLRTLAAGLDELPERLVLEPALLDGIRAALRVVEDCAADAPPALRGAVAAVARTLEPDRCRAIDTLPGLTDCLRAVATEALHLSQSLPEDAPAALRSWTTRLAKQCDAQVEELFALAPWMRTAQEYVIGADLTRIPTLRELAAFEPPSSNAALARHVAQGRDAARRRLARIDELAQQARELAKMDFRALYDAAAGLLAAGWHVRDERLDGDSCDLLASEARMASYAAVAQGQLGQEHWQSLGRPVRIEEAGPLLLSRCGALSDYLAPQLLMPSWRDTLLDSAGRALVRAQAAHARRHDLPWGFSESGCNAVDGAARYRFSRFGIPAASLQRRAPDELVAAPYATLLALPVAPALALANLERLGAAGLLGEHGYYEAVDYAPSRLPQGERQVVVRAWVARHQAMGLLGLAQALLDAPMQRRFMADPELRAASVLLQEALPASGAATPVRYGPGALQDDLPAARAYARVIAQGASALPEVQLLSNGTLHAVVGSDGAGPTRWEGSLLTRSGMACYVRDAGSGQLWSNTPQPALVQPERSETVFAEGRASFRRHDHGIDMVTDVVVAPDEDVELRRVRIANRGAAPRTLELTSCVELVAPPVEAGRKSSVSAWLDEQAGALMCVTEQDAPVVLHLMVLRGEAGELDDSSCETSRARFIRRGHDRRAPQAVLRGGALPGVDPEPSRPLLAMRRILHLAPGQEAVVDLVLGATGGLASARELAQRFQSGHAVDHAVEAAWTHGQAFLRRVDVSEADAQLYTRLAGCLLHPVPALRIDAAVIARNVRGREDLAPYGIDGTLPVVLLQVGQGPESDLVRQTLQAHAYWRSRGLAIDLLVLCDSAAAREQVMHLAAPVLDPSTFEQPGGVHVHLLPEVAQEDRILLRSIASAVLSDQRGGLHDQLRRAARPRGPAQPGFEPLSELPAWTVDAPPLQAPQLVDDNGIGGFTPDGREYVVRIGPGVPVPPAPWVNLLANPDFGSVVSERGHAASWSGHHDARVTAGDSADLAPQAGEAFYLRDEDSGAFWSPTPWPAPSGEPYLARHGFGYSVFEHRAQGIRSELRCFVAPDAPLKYAVLRLRNDSSAPRRLSATAYVEWTLDAQGAAPGLQVVTGADLASGALFARNAFGEGFRDKVAFLHADAEQVASTADRLEFLGPAGNMAQPAAMARAGLSGTSGAGHDPCGALQVAISLQPGEEAELVFVLGVAGPGSLDASRVVQRHGGAQAAAAAWEQIRRWWEDTLGVVELHSSDPSFDRLANGWLLYQAIAGAMGARSFALRLQSALAALHARPELLREQLLRAARDSAGGPPPPVEDFLWLPFAVARYAAVTGDHAVLGEHPVDQGDDLYQHCVHGLRGCLQFGARGLPLAAARLHHEAQGPGSRTESVQLSFFMNLVLLRFAEVADRRGDFGFATTCRGAALALAAQTEEHGWDGAWYRWAFLGDGTALGSGANALCRIDLATQAWALLAGAPRAPQAMDAVRGLAERSDPPFDRHWADGLDAWPGQDHRAAAWAGIGFARLGDARQAWELARLLDPARRTVTEEDCERYAGPPYFLTDGVRTIEPHAGHAIGGCYTGAAAWTWLLVAESLLGLERSGQRLLLAPRLPPDWPAFRLRYRYRRTIYEIAVQRGGGAQGMTLDGEPVPEDGIALVDDARLHRIELRLAGDNDDKRTNT
ncbi:GH36-type glycosyl hydrolase domain-containing protein [Massilia sp. ST3]|uniref:GH36-type glycosyl hydrolase domain-containing protein n=1 Tax=Massilia sp. ST3 TaxID=2824903 RepID=UPI0035A371E0